jgi:hypothetical protein
MGCGGARQVKVTTDYHPGAARIVVVPLAVSDELGDARTGIVLSDQARALASDASCKTMAEDSSADHVVCVDQQIVVCSPTFARARAPVRVGQAHPSGAEALRQSVRQTSGARVLTKPCCFGRKVCPRLAMCTGS